MSYKNDSRVYCQASTSKPGEYSGGAAIQGEEQIVNLFEIHGLTEAWTSFIFGPVGLGCKQRCSNGQTHLQSACGISPGSGGNSPLVGDNSRLFGLQTHKISAEFPVAGMKFGWQFTDRQRGFLNGAWKREDDPVFSDRSQFTWILPGYPQVIIKNGTSEDLWHCASWNGLRCSGMRSEGNNS
nr:G-type lectin S-receptor-like serine/threonine-protein kinase At4g27290 [Ipomoea batatas]